MDPAESLYHRLTLSLTGPLDGICTAFFDLFQARHGKFQRLTAFENKEGHESLRFIVRGGDYEGIAVLRELQSPRRVVALWEGTLSRSKGALVCSSLLATGPGFGPWEGVTVYSPDQWVHPAHRRFGTQGGQVEDIDARKAGERADFGSVANELLYLIDRYQYNQAVQILERNRRSIPDRELVRLYRDVAEQTHHETALPSHDPNGIVNTIIEYLREHQGVAVVVDSDGKPI
ncbi:MAG: hypothetical protein J0L75_15585 [Spirochaetes bacterium]|nr:hypothetical protein [Spirochaetota bacterium]